MQTSRKNTSAGTLYHQNAQAMESYCLSDFHILDNTIFPDTMTQGTQFSVQGFDENYFTFDSFPAGNDSPALSATSNASPFSPQGSQSYHSDQRYQSPDNTYGSPLSGSSVIDDGNELIRHKLRELEVSLLGPESDIVDCSYQTARWNQMMEMIPALDLKEVLIACAKAVSEADVATAYGLMSVLDKMVSVSGTPIQRLAAYMLEGLRARFECSGSLIYKSLKCTEPTSAELLSYMGVLYHVCPYWKFAYMSANVTIGEAMENESRIHIIDFQIAQGSQWALLIPALAKRHGGPPQIRITGIDDSQSAHARGGGLEIVGERLSKIAMEHNVPFQFHNAAMVGCEVELKDLAVRHREAIAVNFPYVLHHMPDESVNTVNHRDQLLRLIKSLCPKVVFLGEQESNTNTTPFFHRFVETLDYYTAMFESIDVSRPRDDKQRISAEQHCVARDIVNMIACEGAERVERHELVGKWIYRFKMAGFSPLPMGPSVSVVIREMLKEYNRNYRLVERDGVLWLGWMNRPMVTACAWR